MKLYQVSKVVSPAGPVIKTKHVLANHDREAIQTARTDGDCPTCVVLHEGKRVGLVT